MSIVDAPKGYKFVAEGEVFVGKGYVVVTGDPPDESLLPEEQRHNCDAMGCGFHHVLFRAKVADV